MSVTSNDLITNVSSSFIFWVWFWLRLLFAMFACSSSKCPRLKRQKKTDPQNQKLQSVLHYHHHSVLIDVHPSFCLTHNVGSIDFQSKVDRHVCLKEPLSLIYFKDRSAEYPSLLLKNTWDKKTVSANLNTQGCSVFTVCSTSTGEKEEPSFSDRTSATDVFIQKELYSISFLLFSAPLTAQKQGCGEFGFPEILWVLEFLSQHIKLVLWYKYVMTWYPNRNA